LIAPHGFAAVGLMLIPMTNGLTTTESTNRPTGSDLAVSRHLCAIDGVEPSSGPGAETMGSEPSVYPSADSWRAEVAARLERYRTRRKPRSPRYPSLLLPFDAPETWSRPAPPSGSAAVATAPARAEPDFALQTREQPTAVAAPVLAEPRPTMQCRPLEVRPDRSPEPAPEQSAKVIAFPRSAAIPHFLPSELADRIFDRPRIVEVPEILPPPPALGGMLIEPAPQEPAERRASADFPSALPSASPSASIVRRALAALVDGVVLATALAAFAAVFLRLNPGLYSLRGPLPSFTSAITSTIAGMTAGALGVVAVLLWTAYEFMFVVYTGSTPGLRAAGLRLAAFDGSPLNRRSRRWRVLATFLSAFSAGLGYLWCLLDQDGLCWHDRITHTHVESAPPAE
jgi:uncharacterized RDD family membrane protein YckC